MLCDVNTHKHTHTHTLSLSYQGSLLSVRMFEGDSLQAQVFLDSHHVGLPGCLQQAVTSELICQKVNGDYQVKDANT